MLVNPAWHVPWFSHGFFPQAFILPKKEGKYNFKLNSHFVPKFTPVRSHKNLKEDRLGQTGTDRQTDWDKQADKQTDRQPLFKHD